MKVGTVIIGSGVAATVIAETLLAGDPAADILILEAGSTVKTKDFGLWEEYLISGALPYDGARDGNYPQRDDPGENEHAGVTEVPLRGARLFAYGGSTLHWGGWSFRLKPEDFYLKTNTGEALDWPFDYKTLEPFYCRAEEHLAVSGDSEDPNEERTKGFPFSAFPFTLEDKLYAQAMAKLGIDYSHLPIARRGLSKVPSRHAPCQTTGTCKYCPFGARYVASNHLEDLRTWNDYPNLRVQLEAPVVRIEMITKNRAKGVLFYDRKTGETVTVEADRVVVAAGAIESAKLLLRSCPDEWPDGVGNDHGQVGRYLITHPYFTMTAILPKNDLNLQPELNFPTLVSRQYDSAAEQALGKYIMIAPPDTISLGSSGLNPTIAAMMQAGKSRDDINAALGGRNKITIQGMVEVFGREDNHIRNMGSLNKVGLPMTSVVFAQDPGFDGRMLTIEKKTSEIFAAMGAKPDGTRSVSWRADHAASLCRMSTDELKGVVDANLKVHGTDNLFVISNAVFPNLGAVNPTLTLTALAFRLGDHLVETA